MATVLADPVTVIERGAPHVIHTEEQLSQSFHVSPAVFFPA